MILLLSIFSAETWRLDFGKEGSVFRPSSRLFRHYFYFSYEGYALPFSSSYACWWRRCQPRRFSLCAADIFIRWDDATIFLHYMPIFSRRRCRFSLPPPQASFFIDIYADYYFSLRFSGIFSYDMPFFATAIMIQVFALNGFFHETALLFTPPFSSPRQQPFRWLDWCDAPCRFLFKTLYYYDISPSFHFLQLDKARLPSPSSLIIHTMMSHVIFHIMLVI